MRSLTFVFYATQRRVWLLALVWCALAALFALRAFSRLPVPSTAAAIEWALLAGWLVVPLLAIRRLFADADEDTFALRVTAIRFALLGYVPVWMAMILLESYLSRR